MAIFMDDYDIDNLNREKESSEKKSDDALYCMRELAAIRDESRLGYIRYKVEQFIIRNRNSVDSEIINTLENFLNSNDLDGKKMSEGIFNYLEEYDKKQDVEKESTDKELEDQKEDFAERTLNELKEEGYVINGSSDEIVDSIETNEDMERINDNVEEVLNTNIENTLELDTKNIAKATENNDDDSLLNATVPKQDVPFLDKIDGAIVFTADAKNSNHNNYIAMLAYLTVAPNLFDNTILNNNLDLSITNTNFENEYQVKCGKFPTAKNGIDLESIDKIETCLNNYNPSINYFERLDTLAPEVSTTLGLVTEHFTDKGNFKVILKNNDGRHDIGFKMDDTFNEVSEAFRHSGAMVSTDDLENDVVRVPNDPLFVLKTTKEELDSLKLAKENETSNQLKQNFQKIKSIEEAKEIDMKEAGAVTPIFLTVVAVVEAILIALYFTMIFR